MAIFDFLSKEERTFSYKVGSEDSTINLSFPITSYVNEYGKEYQIFFKQKAEESIVPTFDTEVFDSSILEGYKFKDIERSNKTFDLGLSLAISQLPVGRYTISFDVMMFQGDLAIINISHEQKPHGGAIFFAYHSQDLDVNKFKGYIKNSEAGQYEDADVTYNAPERFTFKNPYFPSDIDGAVMKLTMPNSRGEIIESFEMSLPKKVIVNPLTMVFEKLELFVDITEERPPEDKEVKWVFNPVTFTIDDITSKYADYMLTNTKTNKFIEGRAYALDGSVLMEIQEHARTLMTYDFEDIHKEGEGQIQDNHYIDNMLLEVNAGGILQPQEYDFIKGAYNGFGECNVIDNRKFWKGLPFSMLSKDLTKRHFSVSELNMSDAEVDIEEITSYCDGNIYVKWLGQDTNYYYWLFPYSELKGKSKELGSVDRWFTNEYNETSNRDTLGLTDELSIVVKDRVPKRYFSLLESLYKSPEVYYLKCLGTKSEYELTDWEKVEVKGKSYGHNSAEKIQDYDIELVRRKQYTQIR